MKKIIKVLFLCILIVYHASFGWAIPDSFEIDDTFDLASEINQFDSQHHNFHDPSDEDWVKINGSLAKTYGIYAKNLGSNCNVVLELYYADGTTLLDEQDTIGNPQADEILEWTCPYAGIYYVRVRQYEPCITSDTICENTEYDLALEPHVGGMPGFIVGTVTDASSGESIQGATITTDGGGSAISLPNGAYIMIHQAGSFTVIAEATGYNTQNFIGIIVDEGGITTKDINLQHVVVDTKPDAWIIFPSSNVTVSKDESVYFRGSVKNGEPPFTYSWDFDSGANNRYREDPGYVIFTTEGVYHVTFTVTDVDGDTDSKSVAVTVSNELLDTDGDGTDNPMDSDDDNDGLPDTEEQGPNGDNPDYDGNGDGVADRVQANVTSLHTHGDQNYVTLESPNGTTISDCQATDNPYPKDAPEGVGFPYGFFEFTIEGLDNGGSTTLTLHFPEESEFDTYYKFGPTPDNTADHWYEFLYDGQTGAEFNGNVITLHLMDGMRGDDDITANGAIVDAGGPGVSEGVAYIYFPHIASDHTWETEICVINSSSGQSIVGILKAYNNSGQQVASTSISLIPNARKEIIVGNEFSNPNNIDYIIFESDSQNLCGYTKFYIDGRYRMAIPAASDMNTGDIYISHIASDKDWTTGVSILNTMSSSKDLSIEFDDGTTKNRTILANEHQAFLIRELFDGEMQSNIKSAIIKNGAGIVGLEIFGSTEAIGNSYLSGILLKDDTTTNIYYPHIASNSTWDTGIVAYNPSDTSCNLTITPYRSDGTPLSPKTLTLTGKEKYIGIIQQLNLPEDTAWFSILASSPITGFELFSTKDGRQLGGYTGVGISDTDGVFAKIDKDGGTGIAFVNIEDSPATVTMTAYDDGGNVIATETVNLNAYQKVVDVPSELFSEDISTATYIAYSSTGNVVGFQLNVSSEGMMLDALPGM